jgi:hypothetical protein
MTHYINKGAAGSHLAAFFVKCMCEDATSLIASGEANPQGPAKEQLLVSAYTPSCCTKRSAAAGISVTNTSSLPYQAASLDVYKEWYMGTS